MKKIRHASLFVLFGLLAFAVGCEGSLAPSGSAGDESQPGAETGTSDLAYAGLALEAENGGIDLDSPPSFDAWAAEAGDELGEDPAADVDAPDMEDPEQEPGFAEGKVAVYHLLAVWGHKQFEKDFGDVVDWSGAVSVSKGKVQVERVIAFDPKGDHLVPDQDPRAVTFTSHTGPHHDGLVLRIVVPAGAAEEPTVTFATAPLTATYAASELDGLQEVITVDDLENKVLFLGQKQSFDKPCPKGLVGGFWKRLNAKGGIFGGKWMAANGKVDGKLFGIWGKRNNGDRVFFGTYVSGDKAFKGILAGHWKPFPKGGAKQVHGGSFVGHWVGKGGGVDGMLKGLYGDGDEQSDGKGFFKGVWHAACGGEGKPAPCDGDLGDCAPDAAPECLCADEPTDGDAPAMCVCADDTPIE